MILIHFDKIVRIFSQAENYRLTTKVKKKLKKLISIEKYNFEVQVNLIVGYFHEFKHLRIKK